MKTLLLLAVVLFTSANAYADLINYTYTGLKITGVGNNPQGTLKVTDLFTAEATIDFTATAGVYTATSWSISVGPITISDAEPTLTSSSASFTLDAQGNILFWSLNGRGNFYGTPDSPQDIFFTSLSPVGSGTQLVALDNNSNNAACAFPQSPMTCSWSREFLTSPDHRTLWTRQSVPEPSSLALLVVGTLATAIMRRQLRHDASGRFGGSYRYRHD